MKESIYAASMAALLALLSGCSSPEKDTFMEGWEFWSDANPSHVNVNLPHDAMIGEKRSADAPSGSGGAYFDGGVYHYEKSFEVTPEMMEKSVNFSFGGVYRNSKVFINGREAGGAVYGYIPFTVSADGLLSQGTNTIRVDVDNSETPNSRWYSGSGIFRPVRMVVKDKVNVSSVKVTTKSISPAVIVVEATHNGDEAFVEITDAVGGRIAKTDIEGGRAEITIPGAKLWSAESPNLYIAKVSVKKDGKVTDTVSERFGLRIITWDGNGFYVNGENVLLKGGCLHHDNGVLGAVENQEAAYRKIATLKEYGFNAIRSSHNPTSDEILRACDELGMYVMDELWDMWFFSKTEHDYANYFRDNYISDIETFVARDYNHPSVVMYSIGNEVSEPAMEGGMDVAHSIIDNLHRLDPSRPVTGGINLMILATSAMGQNLFAQQQNQDGQDGGATGLASVLGGGPLTSTAYNAMVSMIGDSMSGDNLKTPFVDQITSPVLDALDIAGYNYGKGRYEIEGEEHPGRIIVGSETMPYDIAKNWKMVERIPYLVGDFMWTAWDYIGEVGIGAWSHEADALGFSKPYPWLLADTGAFDITGQPNGEAFLAKATWESEPGNPYLCVQPLMDGDLVKAAWRGTNSVPSWSWPGQEGKTAVVEVFSAADKIQLFKDGKLLGEKNVQNNWTTFEVEYTPGTLEAVAFVGGKECGRTALNSATGKASLKLSPEKILTKGGDVVYVDVEIVGENGEVYFGKESMLNASVEGGTLLGFGSAKPRSDSYFGTGHYPSWMGHALAVVKVGPTGKATLTVGGEGLDAVKVNVSK
ncbi:MAG: DUF4982 domain-containing protein [Bacteroidales bacterium]|nr:DUF4982 domain-containing protein [Bacteroidales bacterium]